MRITNDLHRIRPRPRQSMAIMDFLEEAYPMGGALLPRDPVARAQAKEYAEMVNSGTQPLQVG